MTLKELVNEWLYVYHKAEIKRRTLLRYESIIRTYVFPYWGERNIDDITPRDIQLWVNALRETISEATHKPLSPSSLNCCIGVLRQSFAYSENYEILDYNPTRKIKRIPEKRDDKLRVLTRDEQRRFESYIDKANNPEYFVYILVLYTGLRLGEVTALTYQDINIRTGMMSINKTRYKTTDDNGNWIYVTDTPKTDKSIREIPLPSFLWEKFKEMKRNRKSKYVISRVDGKELSDKVIVWRLKRIFKKARIRQVNFHSLRHTFATRALENKMDIKTLSEILGHSDVTTTLNIYTHSLIKHKKQSMRKIKRLV